RKYDCKATTHLPCLMNRRGKSAVGYLNTVRIHRARARDADKWQQVRKSRANGNCCAPFVRPPRIYCRRTAFLSPVARTGPSPHQSTSYEGAVSSLNSPKPADRFTASEHIPTACPACQSLSIVTTAKTPDATSYWRCISCGEIWNTSRRREG